MRFKSEFNDWVNRQSNQSAKFLQHFFTPTDVLGNRNGHVITVSDMIETIEYLVEYIVSSFDVDEGKYAKALSVLKIYKSLFKNERPRKPYKEEMHSLVDVIHEYEDLRAENDEIKKENENKAAALNFLIDMNINV